MIQDIIATPNVLKIANKIIVNISFILLFLYNQGWVSENSPTSTPPFDLF